MFSQFGGPEAQGQVSVGEDSPPGLQIATADSYLLLVCSHALLICTLSLPCPLPPSLGLLRRTTFQQATPSWFYSTLITSLKAQTHRC